MSVWCELLILEENSEILKKLFWINFFQPVNDPSTPTSIPYYSQRTWFPWPDLMLLKKNTSPDENGIVKDIWAFNNRVTEDLDETMKTCRRLECITGWPCSLSSPFAAACAVRGWTPVFYLPLTLMFNHQQDAFWAINQREPTDICVNGCTAYCTRARVHFPEHV